MNPLEDAGVGELGEVAPDGLNRDTEMRGKAVDGHLPVAAGDVEDLALAKGLGHWTSGNWGNGAKTRGIVKFDALLFGQ